MGTDGDPLEQLRRALDRLVEVDPGALADGQAVVEIHRQLARLEAVATRSSAAFDRTGRWRADGARTPAAWLAARCSLPEATARRRVRLGRDVPHLPVAERAWLDGDIASSAVELLARARNETTAARLAADEPELVDGARRLHPRTFARVVTASRRAAWRCRASMAWPSASAAGSSSTRRSSARRSCSRGSPSLPMAVPRGRTRRRTKGPAPERYLLVSSTLHEHLFDANPPTAGRRPAPSVRARRPRR